jgi:hypothetical protein
MSAETEVLPASETMPGAEPARDELRPAGTGGSITLLKYDAARQALAAAYRVDEVKDTRRKQHDDVTAAEYNDTPAEQRARMRRDFEARERARMGLEPKRAAAEAVDTPWPDRSVDWERSRQLKDLMSRGLSEDAALAVMQMPIKPEWLGGPLRSKNGGDQV